MGGVNGFGIARGNEISQLFVTCCVFGEDEAASVGRDVEFEETVSTY